MFYLLNMFNLNKCLSLNMFNLNKCLSLNMFNLNKSIYHLICLI